MPPSRETLLLRLTDRGQDDEMTIKKRMDEAVSEMSHYGESDYLVINDDFDLALQDLLSVIRSYRLQQSLQAASHQQLITELLG